MKKRVLLTLLMLITLVALLVIPADAASNSAEVQIGGIEDYDAANEVLRLMNTARAEEGLPPLKMDPALSQWAMQRAAECSVYYSHTRPDGTSCFSICSDYYSQGGVGENIAVGYATSAAVHAGWMKSPGHHANIMNSNYQTVGIGCFYLENGTKNWVQLFSGSALNGRYNASGTKIRTDVSISIAPDMMDAFISAPNGDVLNLHKGQTMPLQISLNNLGWCYATPMPLTGGYTATCTDTSVLKINNRKIIGVKPGTATVRVIFNGTSVHTDEKVTVQKLPVISHRYDGVHAILTWTGDSSLVLFYKEQNDEIWTLGDSGNYCNHTGYAVKPGDVYIYQLRYWNGEEYVPIGKDITRAGPVTYLLSPSFSISTVASTGHLKLSWPKVPGAVKYNIYRAIDDGSTLTLYKTVTATSFVDTAAKIGQLYCYDVEAVAANGITGRGYCPQTGSRLLAQPKLTVKNVAVSGNVRLTWKKVAGATRYDVWYATNKAGIYTKLATTAKLTFTHTSAKPGTKYFYKVIASNGNEYADSVASAPVMCTFDLACPVVTAKNAAASGRIQLSWKAVSGAVRYKIYRATDKAGKYVKIGTAAGTAFTDTTAKAGSTYYYKVTAIHKKPDANSANSAEVTATARLVRPAVSITCKAGNPRVSWKKVTGAVKYQVWRATGPNGKYTFLCTVTGKSATDVTAKSGSIYYYKVRAICRPTAGNSAFSPTVNICAK